MISVIVSICCKKKNLSWWQVRGVCRILLWNETRQGLAMTVLEEPPPGSHSTCSGNPLYQGAWKFPPYSHTTALGNHFPATFVYLMVMKWKLSKMCIRDGKGHRQKCFPQSESSSRAFKCQPWCFTWTRLSDLPGNEQIPFATLKNHLKRLTAFFYSVMAFSVCKNRAWILRLKLFLLTPFIEDGNMNKMFYG